MPDVIGVIQARMSSSRLPGKILAPLAGRPILEWIATRLAASRVEEWWLATTDDPSDDISEAWGHELGLRVYRGQDHNVLSRFTNIIRERDPKWVVRITSDDPFVHASVVDQLLDARDEFGKEANLLQTGAPPSRTDPGPAAGLPLGFGVQMARADALLRAEAEIPESEAFHRSHVMSWLDRQGEAADVPPPKDWPSRPRWRWTVDTFDDLAMARSAFGLFGDAASRIDYPEMVALLDAHPEIALMNQSVSQKAIEQG